MISFQSISKNIFNFCLYREEKSTENNNVNNADHYPTKKCEQSGNWRWQSSALVSPTKTLNRGLAPIGDDIEPVGESRADVEMGNEEDAEPLEAEIPRVRMNPKNPTRRENQEHEDSGHAVYRSWCAACAEGRDVGGQRRIELFEERRKRKDDSDRSFRLRFSETGKRRHVSNSDLQRQQGWSKRSDML